MSITDALDESLQKLRDLLEKKLKVLKQNVGNRFYRDLILETIDAAQNLYNNLELAFGLLKDYPGNDSQFTVQLERELFGNTEQLKPCVNRVDWSARTKIWESESVDIPLGGINRIITLLTSAMRFPHNGEDFVMRVYSAAEELQPTLAAITKLKSRLKWTVMYPDSFSHDIALIDDGLKQLGFDKVWAQFLAGVENYVSGDFLDSLNNLRNALTLFVKDIAKMYDVDEMQFGTQRSNLTDIGFLDKNLSGDLSNLFGHLSKFSKGNAVPTQLDAKYLLDRTLTVFGYLLLRTEEFDPTKS